MTEPAPKVPETTPEEMYGPDGEDVVGPDDVEASTDTGTEHEEGSE